MSFCDGLQALHTRQSVTRTVEVSRKEKVVVVENIERRKQIQVLAAKAKGKR